MTYKGKEITEEEITLEVVSEIVHKHYIDNEPEEYNKFRFRDFDKDKVYDYQKVLDVFLRYLHNRQRKLAIDDIETCICQKMKISNINYYTAEYENYKLEEKRARRKRVEERIAAESLKKAVLDTLEASQEPSPNTPLTYVEQMKDKRWYSFRNFVFVVRGYKCEKCGSVEHLQVHHFQYVSGRKAWEYNCNEVQVLCKKCHKELHGIKRGKKTI